MPKNTDMSCHSASCPHKCDAHPQQALNLIEKIPWPILSDFAPTVRDASIDRLVASGLYLASWHNSLEDPPPCLLRCLEGALNQIILVKMSRFGSMTQQALCEWLVSARHFFAKGLPASLYAKLRLQSDDFILDDFIDVALNYWIEAAEACDTGNHARSWPSLAQAHLYLGLVIGPTYAKEASQKGGWGRGGNYDPLRKKILELLQVIPDKHFLNLADARAAIIPKLQDFCKESPGHRSTNLDRFLKKITQPKQRNISTEAAKIRAELHRITRHQGAGRPPKKQY